MATTIRLAKSLRPRKRGRFPPFFDGSLRLEIIMAISEFGPMRPYEIEALYDTKRYHSSRTGQAARYLERLGIVHCKINGYHNFTIGLDRRHPAFPELQRFGRALFKLYVTPMLRWKWRKRPIPSSRRPPITPLTPKYDPATLDMHVFGQGASQKFLHLFAEIESCPKYVTRGFLGASTGPGGPDNDWARFGIVNQIQKGQRVFHGLNRSWPAYRALRSLLNKLNSYLPEYKALAAAYYTQRDLGHYERKWIMGQTRKRRISAMYPTAKMRPRNTEKYEKDSE